MDTRDIDGTHYQNEDRTFYAPEKEAKVKTLSHAYRWISGKLQGYCREIDGDVMQESLPAIRTTTDDELYPVDTIFLEPAALFGTNSSNLSSDGENLLKQVRQRLSSYSEILHLSIDGHTDNRGSVKSNTVLSEQRAQRVASALYSIVPAEKIRIKASSEHRPTNSNSSEIEMAANRRVSVTAVVSQKDFSESLDASQNTSAVSTLCSTRSKDQADATLKLPIERLKDCIEQSLQPAYADRPPLSAGDRIRLIIPEGTELSGVYEIGIGGQMEVLFLGLLQVQGLDTRILEQTIHDRLLEEQIFLPGMLRVSTTIQEWAPIDVLVSGATFDPGRVTINQQKTEYRTFKQSQVSGDFAKNRLLSAALYSAGGIRPDADLNNVQLIRNGEVKKLICADCLMAL